MTTLSDRRSQDPPSPDLTITYDNGVDVVRLEGVDFPTTGAKGLSGLLPDKAGDGILRILCIVIAPKVTIRLEGIIIAVLLVDNCTSTTLGPHFTGALRSQYILPSQPLQGIATSLVGIDLGLPVPIFAAVLALATAASFIRES